MSKILLSLIYLINLNIYAQTSETIELPARVDNTITEDQIINSLEKLLGKPESDYLSTVSEIDSLADMYIEQKKSVCSGELASIDLGVNSFEDKKTEESTPEKKVQIKKLTPQERKLCQYLLVKFRIRYTKTAFKIRKAHLIQQQEKERSSLDELRDSSVKELEKLSHRYQ